MNLTKEQVKDLYKITFKCCADVCQVSKLIDGDFDDICDLCQANNQQFFVPTDEFVNEVNSINIDDNLETVINIAKGCLDYKGGHDGENLIIYRHGIQTVVSALENHKENRLNDTILKHLH